jgi:hypothetical protein
MAFMDSPTDEFMSSQFYIDYQYYKGVLQYCIDNANNAACDSAELALLVAELTGLRDSYDNMMYNYGNVAYGIYDALSSTGQCVINSIDSPELNNLQSTMSDSLSNILNSSYFTNVHNQIMDIKQAIDDSLPCDTVRDLTSNTQSTVNGMIDKANQMFDALNSYDSLLITISQGLTKIANVASCLRAGAANIGYYTSLFAPDLASAVNETYNASGNVGQKVQAGINELKAAIDLDNKLSSIANTLRLT